MKRIAALITIIVLSVEVVGLSLILGCGPSAEQRATENARLESLNNNRIKMIESTTTDCGYIYIVKVDCTEYIVTERGGIMRHENK